MDNRFLPRSLRVSKNTPGPAIFIGINLSSPFFKSFRIRATTGTATCLLFISGARAEDFAFQASSRLFSQPLRITGEYTPPKKPQAPVLILLHGLGSSRQEWRPLEERAWRLGWGTLSYDARGHGQSRKTTSNQEIRYDDPRYGRNPLFWREMIDDLERALGVLVEEKGLDRSRMVLAGASLGANVCLNTAAKFKDVRAVVLLSPGLNYVGIETEAALRLWNRPTLLIAAAPDKYAYASVKKLVRETPHKPSVMLLAQGGRQGAHGTQLFDGALEEKILSWISNNGR